MHTFSVLIWSSSTLACKAAEACLYSSNRWYAANDDASENPNKKPTILVNFKSQGKLRYFPIWDTWRRTLHESRQQASFERVLFRRSVSLPPPEELASLITSEIVTLFYELLIGGIARPWHWFRRLSPPWTKFRSVAVTFIRTSFSTIAL